VTGIPIVTLEPGVSRAIKSFLAAKCISQPIRIDLGFTGCCDASLCMSVDRLLDGDIIEEVDNVTFVINPETYEITGDITISLVDETDRKGFVLGSAKPISEWDGFGVCEIRT